MVAGTCCRDMCWRDGCRRVVERGGEVCRRGGLPACVRWAGVRGICCKTPHERRDVTGNGPFGQRLHFDLAKLFWFHALDCVVL